MNQKIYTFYSAGFIPGVPGILPGGHQYLVDEDSHQILASGPVGQPLVAEPDQAPATEPEAPPSGDQPSAASSTSVPDSFNFLKGA